MHSSPADGRASFLDRATAFAPELIAAALAAVVFLVGFGGIPLASIREEHVAADAVDTLANNHWLVAYDHDTPRLKKPPLPRWVSAAAVWAVGEPTEFAVRLPGRLAAVGVCLLVFLWGRRTAGRAAGAAAVLIFSTTFLVIG
ncbi:MAG: ArnT family glycosyltransferase, partial [Planctomycetia bacterium]